MCPSWLVSKWVRSILFLLQNSFTTSSFPFRHLEAFYLSYHRLPRSVRWLAFGEVCVGVCVRVCVGGESGLKWNFNDSWSYLRLQLGIGGAFRYIVNLDLSCLDRTSYSRHFWGAKPPTQFHHMRGELNP